MPYYFYLLKYPVFLGDGLTLTVEAIGVRRAERTSLTEGTIEVKTKFGKLIINSSDIQADLVIETETAYLEFKRSLENFQRGY